MGSTLAWGDHSKIVCLRVRATISSPVRALRCAVVVMTLLCRLKRGPYCRGQLRRAGLAADVRRTHLALLEHPADGAQDAVVDRALAEVVEHHGPGPDRSHRVGDALARDAGGGAVD